MLVGTGFRECAWCSSKLQEQVGLVADSCLWGHQHDLCGVLVLYAQGHVNGSQIQAVLVISMVPCWRVL